MKRREEKDITREGMIEVIYRGTWRICTRVYEWQLHPLGELLSEVSTILWFTVVTSPLLKS